MRYDRRFAPRVPHAAMLQYTAALRAYLKELHGRIGAEVERVYRQPPGRRVDIALDEIDVEIPPIPIDAIQVVAQRVNEHASTEVRRIFDERGVFQGRFQAPTETNAIRRIVLANFDPRTAAQLPTFRQENSDLIKSISEDLLGEVRDLLSEAWEKGWHSDDLRARLLERFGVSESRADLIARDQTLKLHADITKTRQQAAGIERYRWSTSKDERVRPYHRKLDGQVFSWSAPPVTDKRGNRNHPGKDFQCRCVAIPLIPGIDYPESER